MRRALAACDSGAFSAELAPVTVKSRKGEQTGRARTSRLTAATSSRIPQLKPAFSKDGTVTAASSSSIADGAAALVLMSESAHARGRCHAAGARGCLRQPRAGAGVVHDRAGRRDSARAASGRLADAGRGSVRDQRGLRGGHHGRDARAGLWPHEKVNVNGGACALGHPIGASGARIIITLVHALRHRKLRRGVASLCIGGGEATAIAIEIADSR